MPRLLPIAALLVVAGVGGWITWQGTAEAPAASTSTASEAATTAANANLAAGQTVAVRQQVTPTEANTGPPPIPATAIWVDVTIVDGATKEPVPGVDACWMDDSLWRRVEALPAAARLGYYGDDERVAREFGWRGRSDSQGRLRVHAHTRGTSMFARKGEQFGSVELVPEDSQRDRRLELTADHTLHVRVVDHQGKPAAEVPVVITENDADGDEFGQELTDHRGEATFAHLQQWWSPEDDPGAASVPPPRWRAIVRFPDITDCWQVFAPKTLPLDAMTLTLPPTGELMAHVLFRGQPVDQALVRIFLGAPDDNQAFNNARCQTTDANGVARFSFAPLGQTWQVVASVGWEDVPTQAVGPVSAGQQVHVMLEVPTNCVVLTGRILTPDGRPVVRATLETAYDTHSKSGRGSLDTDEQGRFVWYRGRSEQPGKLDLLTVSMIDNAQVLRAVVPSRPLVSGTNDLGDIRLAPLPLVVAGRVVFERPSSRNWIEIAVERWLDRSDLEEKGFWQELDDLVTTVDDDHHFVVHGAVRPGRFRLTFPCTTHLPAAPVEFPLGADDLVIPLELGHSLSICCHLPDGVQPASLLFDLVRSTSTAAPTGDDRLHAADDSEEADGLANLYWSSLWPDTYTLQVRLRGRSEPLATFAELRVPTTTSGDRALELDLRSELNPQRIHVERIGTEDRNGAVFVFVDAGHDDYSWYGHDVLDGSVCLLLPKHPVDLVIASEGFRPQTLRSSPGPVNVRLEPWPRVRVTLCGLPELPESCTVLAGLERVVPGPPGAVYGLQHRALKADVLDAPGRGVPVASDGSVDLPIGDEPRRVTVSLQLDDRSAELHAFEATLVQPGAGVVTIQLSTAEVQKAVTELQKQEKQ